jgi:hypothetical protein
MVEVSLEGTPQGGSPSNFTSRDDIQIDWAPPRRLEGGYDAAWSLTVFRLKLEDLSLLNL